mgnify:FL=1|jgi:hypothetical protein|nr:MAG TPA: hypothetical protein [Bacteriophage sp.]
MNNNKIITHELPISEKLYGILNDYIHETEYDEKSYNNIDEFIIEAIVEKFNNENEIFSGEVDENGFVTK